MKPLPILFPLLLLLVGCAPSGERKEQGNEYVWRELNPKGSELEALTTTQAAAFEALNALQISMDEEELLYSSFAGAAQACVPPDSIFTISQQQFHAALLEFTSLHCHVLQPSERDSLALQSSMAAEQYTVLLCTHHEGVPADTSNLPMTGTWVLPAVLGRRDVVMNW